jgi:hypothetical protein
LHPLAGSVFLGPFLVMALTGLVCGQVMGRGFGVTLTSEALISHGLCRRVLPWSEITGITRGSRMGTRRVEVHLCDGRTVRLRAPLGGFPWDPDFERKFHTIGQWWLARRAMAAAPAGQPSSCWGSAASDSQKST